MNIRAQQILLTAIVMAAAIMGTITIASLIIYSAGIVDKPQRPQYEFIASPNDYQELGFQMDTTIRVYDLDELIYEGTDTLEAIAISLHSLDTLLGVAVIKGDCFHIEKDAQASHDLLYKMIRGAECINALDLY
jgi:hypothetical protein